MNQILLNNSVVQMKNLYVNHKQEYLRQYPEPRGYQTVKGYLNDGVIRGHLQKNRTIGVKLSRITGLTKFLTFDIDYADDLEQAKYVAEKLIGFLNSYYSIDLDKIHCHFSGNKGYHVTIFFDGEIQDRGLVPFYNEVLTELELSPDKVEFRASSQYGVKLPLSIHQKTGKFMNYMKYDAKVEMMTPLTEQESITYFLNIEPLNLNDFREYVLNDIKSQEYKPTTFTYEEGREVNRVLDTINTEGKSRDEIIKDVTTVINNNHLTYGGTRNNLTYYTSIFLKEQGWSEEDTVGQISSFITNTYNNPKTRHLISEDTTLEYALDEVVRLTKNTYKHDYNLGGRESQPKVIRITKEEILEILSIKQWHLKKLMFSLLIHDKRYTQPENNGQFYMAYSVMTKMGNTGERPTLRKYTKQLEQLGKIAIIHDHQLVERIHNQIIHSVYGTRTRVYKITMDSTDSDSEEFFELDVNTKISLEEATKELLDTATVKKLLPRRQWENHFRSLYTI